MLLTCSSSPAGASKEEKRRKSKAGGASGLPKRKASYTQKDLEDFIDTAPNGDDDDDDDDIDLADLSSDDDDKLETKDNAAASARRKSLNDDDNSWMGEKIEGPKTFDSGIVSKPRLNFGAAIKVFSSSLLSLGAPSLTSICVRSKSVKDWSFSVLYSNFNIENICTSICACMGTDRIMVVKDGATKRLRNF